MIALVICAKSPAKVGAVVWHEHPTLRALIKMVTSSRFRFPTVDCDESERNEMKRLEHDARDEVSGSCFR
jgi:DNA-binding transcriptional MocR family regulator